MTAELKRIVEHQRSWALRREIEVLQSGHTVDPAANLSRPLDAATRSELERAASRPLGDDRKPGDIQLLTSTTALVQNAFGAHREAPGAIATAVGGDPESTSARFCAPVGEGSSEIEVPLLLAGDACRPTVVTATYAEPYQSKRPRRSPANRVPTRSIEDPSLAGLLPGCRNLAFDLSFTPRRYEHLDVADLLTKAIALTQTYGPRGFRLVHLWHEIPGHAADHYRREIERFRFRAGGEIDLCALTWQELVTGLAEAGAGGSDLDYLRERYLHV